MLRVIRVPRSERKKGRAEGMGTEAIPLRCVTAQRLLRRCVNRDVARLAELALPHRQDTAGEVDIGAVQA